MSLRIMRLPTGHQLGAYRIDRLIGTGGFADVYLARQVLLDQPVALKVVREAPAAPREQHGARLMCRLRHPHIVRVHFADRIGGRLVIAMDFVEGETLRARLDSGPPLPLAEAVRIARALSDAAHYLHTFDLDGRRGFAHLDLKPCNILMTLDGEVRIVDFGLAQVRLDQAGEAPVTAGSPAYMAPEQLTGEPSPASDIWAIGVVLYEMVTGVLPVRVFQEAGFPVVAEPEPGFGAGVERRVAAIVDRCLQVNPQDRFETAEALVVALDELRKPEPRCAVCQSRLLDDHNCPECTRVERRERSASPQVFSRAGRDTRSAPQPGTMRGGWMAAAAVVLLALAAVGYAGAAAYIDDRRGREIEQAWTAMRAVVDAPEAGYDDRIGALEVFARRWPGTAEAATAEQELPRWQKEARLFSAADTLDRNPETDASTAIRSWLSFASAQTSGVRRAHADARLADWEARLTSFTGWALLTVVGASGLPAPSRGFWAPAPPDPYFILRNGGEFVYRSVSLKGDPAPDWGESVRVRLVPGRDLVVEVYDRNILRDDLLASVPLGPLPLDGVFARTAGSVMLTLELRRER